MRVRDERERWKVEKINTIEWFGWWGVTIINQDSGLNIRVATFPEWQHAMDWLYGRLVSDG